MKHAATLPAPGPGRRRPAGQVWAPVALIGATVLVSAWGLARSREEARAALADGLRLRAEAEAAALEAVIASLRSDFVFLTQARPIPQYPALARSEDPTARRWGRLEAEATMVRFLEAHPEILALSIRGPGAAESVSLERGGEIAVRRQDGVPVVVERVPPPEPAAPSPLRGRFPIGEDGAWQLEAEIDWGALLRQSGPGRAEVVTRVDPESEDLPESHVRVTVSEPDWDPPVEEVLSVSLPPGGRLRSELRMAARFRNTLAVNVGLTVLGLVAGVFSYRTVRRRAEAEAAYAQDLRVRELERQVLHSERLASVGRFAAGLAHEINNPLEGMSNYLAVLRTDLESGRSERSFETVARIREGVDRVAAITRRVLAYSDPGRAPREVLDLRQVVSETVQFLSSRAELRESTFVDRAPAEPVPVEGDAVTLGQLLLNLLLNAAEGPATDRRVEIEWAVETDAIELRVRDHGPGIPPEHLERIFEPFFSGRGSTGLGLSICLGIVQAHGGTLEARNHPDGGANLVVRLPRAPFRTPRAGRTP